MYSNHGNSSYDQEAIIEVPEVYRWKFENGVWKPREDTHIEFHQCGYVEGDTNAAVENANASGWTWGTIEDGFDRGYDEVTEREQWLTNPHDARRAVYYLNSISGKIAIECQRQKQPFRYDGQTWRVYRLQGIKHYSYTRSGGLFIESQVGRNDNYSCYALLLDWGTEVFWEWLNDQETNPALKWSDCDCQSDYGY